MQWPGGAVAVPPIHPSTRQPPVQFAIGRFKGAGWVSVSFMHGYVCPFRVIYAGPGFLSGRLSHYVAK